MTSPAPLELGSYYHLFNRGVNRENIFLDPECFRNFLQLYAIHIPKVAETFAYCLLRNHFHLLIRVKTPSEILNGLGLSRMDYRKLRYLPSRCFSNFFNAYAKKINLHYERTGSLFQHPFRRIVIKNDAHLQIVISYIHRNPQHHRMVQDYRAWPFSSYHSRALGETEAEGYPVLIAKYPATSVRKMIASDRHFNRSDVAPLLIDDFN